MREIKFRAKASVNDKGAGIKKGDWVYGCYIETRVDAPCIIWGDGEQIEIDRETLGQLTGLKDLMGNDIFEGDIVLAAGEYPSSVGFDDGGFTLHWSKGDSGDSIANVATNRYEVVSNVHDNPTMIKAA